MSIYVLNCATMRPWFLPSGNGVTCLLIETNQGPVLVDTGLGVADYLRPGPLMRVFTALVRSPRDVAETALHHVQRLGYRPTDVRHIIMTHLHIDHAGGLPDFSHATVHLYQPEYDHIASGRAGWEYIRGHWAHGPTWAPHQLRGETWYDFDAVRLEGFDPEIWLVPLPGHSPGHAAVAVRSAQGWVLHGGDAVPYNVALDDVPDWLSRLLLGPHVPRLRTFMQNHPDVHIVGAHMALDFYQTILIG